jgi:hypothetical protein
MKGRVGGGEEDKGDKGDGKVAGGKGEGEAEFADSGIGGGLSRSGEGGSRSGRGVSCADSSRPVLEEGGGEEGEELRGVLGAVGGAGGDGEVCVGGGGHALEWGGRERQTRETRNQVLLASSHTDAHTSAHASAHTDTRLALVGGRLGGSRLEGVCVGSKRQEERWDVGGMVLNLLASYLLY